jgi:RNA polymerase sigma-70 factor (ECF subfamily)
LQTAEDLCQNGWIKAFEKIEMWNNTGSIQGWVKRVITNSIIDELRKKKNIYKEIDVNILNIPNDPPYEEKPYREDIIRVSDKLSKRYKEIFTLYIDGFTHKQIAKKLGISVGTSKSNLFKAKKNIKKYLKNG